MSRLSLYSSCYEAAKRMEQERIKQGLRKHKPVTERCDDFYCYFVGTELCMSESCDGCKLKNCRGCEHLEECFDEMMEV